jgi:hypothetical protein
MPNRLDELKAYEVELIVLKATLDELNAKESPLSFVGQVLLAGTEPHMS